MITQTDTQIAASNFSFLEPYETLLPNLGMQAERCLSEDPGICALKLRQMVDLLAQRAALALGIAFDPADNFLDLLNYLRGRGVARQVLDIFRFFSKLSADAADGVSPTEAEVLHCLKLAWALAEWYVRLITNDLPFTAPPFFVPPDSRQVAAELRAQLEELTNCMSLAEERAPMILADGIEFDLKTFNEQLAKPSLIARTKFRIDQTELDPDTVAIFQLTLNEEDTWRLIEEQLRLRGWQANREEFHFKKGTRPTRHKNLVIAGWPTESGPADYALFIGTKCIGIIAVNNDQQNLSNAINEVENYSRGFKFIQGAEPLQWPCSEYRGPFVFSTNGKGYVKQTDTSCGIWFRDARSIVNRSRVLVDWPTPEALVSLYEINYGEAHAVLKALPMKFGFDLRPYQGTAIEVIEMALKKDRRRMLIAMAPGTGKTKMTIGLLYRLFSAKRIRNACYVVDGEALKEQAEREFKTTKVVGEQTLAEALAGNDISDQKPNSTKRMHICTVQELTASVLNGSEITSCDQYDLIVLDECHYGSRYCQALDHLDAVKIALTATSTLHASKIFGEAIFNYSYREAVLDGYLINHEPPIQIKTGHSQENAHIQPDVDGESDERKNATSVAFVPDDIHFDTEYFDQQIATLEFSRAIAQELANHIDPKLPGKTLVFARDDAHADILVDQLRRAYNHGHGKMDHTAISKITSKSACTDDLILSCRDGVFPKFVVTDDLLTCGIDLPNIVNLVLVRRVRGRLLYEQMLGRATRPCEQIGKQKFRIFDAVDLCRRFAPINSMKPITVNPFVTIKQLFEQIQRLPDELHRDLLYEQIIVTMRMRIRELDKEAIDKYTSKAGELPGETLRRFRNSTPNDVVAWLRYKPELGPILDRKSINISGMVGSDQQPALNLFRPEGLKTILQSVRSYLPR